MATTYTLVFPAVEDLDLKVKRISDANEANFALVDSAPGSASYVYNAGAAADVITLEARRSYDAKNDMTRCSLRMSTDIRKAVSETGEVTDLPVEAVLAWNYQGQYAADISDVASLVTHLIGLALSPLDGANGYTTGVLFEQFDRNVLTELV